MGVSVIEMYAWKESRYYAEGRLNFTLQTDLLRKAGVMRYPPRSD
jgi:hypothetical protein